MKWIVLMAAFLGSIAAGGLVAAQAPAPAAGAADDHAAHHPAPAKAAPPATSGTGAKGTDAPAHADGMMAGGMCGHMMGGGAMGGGMMGHMMGGMGAMMGAPGTKVDVKKTDRGVTITLTAPDTAGATRLQKMAEAVRLMHEAMGQ